MSCWEPEMGSLRCQRETGGHTHTEHTCTYRESSGEARKQNKIKTCICISDYIILFYKVHTVACGLH